MSGRGATVDEALQLNEMYDTDALCEAADEVRRRRKGDAMDTCSIVNARSGRCSEDCKWCAQSGRFSTGVDEYDIVADDDLDRALELNDGRRMGRFSLVTSGRRVSARDIDRFCDLYRRIAAKSNIYLCASMGLIGKDELVKLREAGVKRYHCNLETSSSYFGELCTTHSHADKLRTIRAAREAGMEICCGGIIGMGETMRQRLELCSEALAAGACSIPINILQPIKGTALADTPLIGEDEVARTVALFRLMAPDAVLRFAGGRARLSETAVRRILRGGMNGALVGDMLTTIGNKMDEDERLFSETGFRWGEREAE